MKAFIIVILIFIISGCTASLWSPEYNYETVNGFYVNKERGELFVTSNSSGFLFPIDERLQEALTLSREILFNPKILNFAIDSDNNINGQLELETTNTNLSKHIENKLKHVGFIKKNNNSKYLILSKKLKGKRYAIQGTLPLEKLDKKLNVRILKIDGYTKSAGKIIATPAAIVFDIGISIPLGTLFVVVISSGI